MGSAGRWLLGLLLLVAGGVIVARTIASDGGSQAGVKELPPASPAAQQQPAADEKAKSKPIVAADLDCKPKGCVDGSDVADDAITSKHLLDGTVTASKLAFPVPNANELANEVALRKKTEAALSEALSQLSLASQGGDIATLASAKANSDAALAVEKAAREQADTALQSALTAETLARTTADTNEANARAAKDDLLDRAIAAEAEARRLGLIQLADDLADYKELLSDPDKVGTANDPTNPVSYTRLKNIAVAESHIVDLAISTRTLANGAVTSLKIADGTIVTADLAGKYEAGIETIPGAVTGEKIKDETIESRDIKDGEVKSSDIGTGEVKEADLAGTYDGSGTETVAGAVTGEKIKDETIESRDIKDGTIELGDLDADSVDAGKIVNGSVGTAELAGNYDGSDAETVVGAVTSAKIADGTIRSRDIGNGEVKSVDIGDGEVDAVDLKGTYDGSGTETVAGAVTGEKIKDGTIESRDLKDGEVKEADLAGAYDGAGTETVAGAVTGEKIKDGTIESRDIKDGDIKSGDVGTGEIKGSVVDTDGVTFISQGNIALNAITAHELADKAVDTTAIQDGAVTGEGGKHASAVPTGKLALETVTGGTIASPGNIAQETITKDNLAPNSVDKDELADGAVDTLALVDGAVTSAKIEANAEGTAAASSPGPFGDGTLATELTTIGLDIPASIRSHRVLVSGQAVVKCSPCDGTESVNLTWRVLKDEDTTDLVPGTEIAVLTQTVTIANGNPPFFTIPVNYVDTVTAGGSKSYRLELDVDVVPPDTTPPTTTTVSQVEIFNPVLTAVDLGLVEPTPTP